jgi:hypothetical protein
MLEVQKDLEDVSPGIAIFINPIHQSFVQKLTSKLARSTLIFQVGISLGFWEWTKQVKSGSNIILQGTAGVNFCF